MGVKTTIDTKRGIAVQTVEGDLKIDDVIAAQKRLYLEPGHDPSMPVLWDARRSRAIMQTFNGLSEMVDKSRSFWDRMGQGRTAILVGSVADYGMGRMYAALADSMPREIRVFQDYDEAVAWLTG